MANLLSGRGLDSDEREAENGQSAPTSRCVLDGY